MRAPSLVVFAGALVLLGRGIPLKAQDEADSIRVDTLDAWSESDTTYTDSVEVRRPVRRGPAGNPYLREVRESRPASPRRGPYYASFGVGFGSEAIAGLGAPSPYAPSRIRPTLDFGVGATIGQSLRIGLDGFAWFNITRDGALETVSAAMIGARFYPMPSSGFYLRAAGGVGRYGQDLIDDYCDCSEPIVSDYGWAYAIGGGLEVPVGRGLWLGPSLEMVRMDITGPGGYRERVLNFGITLTYDGH